MGHFAYLTPVGPFAGLSNSARRKIAEHFPGVPVMEIENDAACFSRELEAAATEPRLAEAREELDAFSQEIARFRNALHRIRAHRLDKALGESSRMIGGEDEFTKVERSLQILKAGAQRTSRAVPLGRAELASRKLVAALAIRVKDARLPVSGATDNSLLSLVDLILDDLMIGGDAQSAVVDWRKSQSPDGSDDTVGTLIDLVVS